MLGSEKDVTNMNKSIYSLVLNDRVVEELDRLAYRQGTSRSALINRILADYVSYQTPEMRLRQVMDSAVSALDTVEALQLMLQPAGSSMATPRGIRRNSPAFNVTSSAAARSIQSLLPST